MSIRVLPSADWGQLCSCTHTRLIGLKDNMLQTGHSDDIALSTDFPKDSTHLLSLKVVSENHKPRLQSSTNTDA